MPWTGHQFAQRHNHSLTPEQAAHAARIANAILKRSGNEGIAIATANKMAHRADGGGYDYGTSQTAPVTPNVSNQNPLTQGMIQRYSSMPTEQLQELAVRMGGSPQAQLIERILQSKRINSAQQQQPSGAQQGQPYGAARGGAMPHRVSGGPMLEMRNGRRLQTWDELQDEFRNRGWHAYMRGSRTGDPDTDPNMQTTAPLSFDANEVWRGPHGGLGQRTTIPPDPQQDARGGIIAHRDDGGVMSFSEASPWWTRREASGADTGFLHGSTPGRADAISGTAPAGSYVLPADVVAGLGEGNSLAGAKAVEMMLNTGPHGIPMPRGSRGNTIPRPPPAFHERNGGYVGKARMWHAPKIYRAGGVAGNGQEPVALSDGEYVIAPEHVARFGGGDHAKGIKWFDEFVQKRRKKDIAKHKSLPPPVGAKKI